MDYFNYQGDTLFAEQVALSEIAANYGTPTYVYSKATIERHYHAFADAAAQHPHSLVCYAVKANSNLAVLNILARLGSGFDLVSAGELRRVIAAGGDPAKVVFSGVGKTAEEMHFALQLGIKCFNVESVSELHRLQEVAKSLNKKAPVSLRVNPDIDAKTHPYISTGLKANKFGIDILLAAEIYRDAKQLSHIELVGVDCHIGSQLTETQPFLDALEKLLALITQLRADGIALKHIDIGGGLGVTYDQEQPPQPSDYIKKVVERLKDYPELELIMEPGRAITANAGVLLTKVEFLKPGQEKHFAIVDAAMNDLIRPALYSAWMNIVPVVIQQNLTPQTYDVVGPVCETGDFLGKDRLLAIREGDLLAVRSAGAYGFTMSSNYNSRPRAAEIMVDGARSHLIRAREQWQDLWRGEQLLAD
ncbi:diaminopimelate decarboxylase [Alishewanella sp. 16-MA]|uniref:Diaminopimelate decarboxylase n=1 Tax=Alishewanella maricola TaxID=2795740 RepID=A0ABS8C4W7_9ALTE|nr:MULTISPECIES: diaminopimelate decarboxylase [Alishewanella]MDP4945303.1 diaminopimelate decarboxylase [Alishewanella sp.]MDP5205961.1 diaminopimelate decarboxylase [Alishewanella sp. SMS9]MCB5227373.1 diaminopimelate decarboxylase [Alishewanella maricola]MDP5035141.1 diaminopimelate decarboxylase [Alishewanella sp.]MDP5186415.1 diaminopimelate decarboxylase [Alishewanella sp.]